jgi:hypothetical protein
MTPFKQGQRQNGLTADSSVPSVSLLDFAEELLVVHVQNKEMPAKRKKSPSTTR